MESLERKDAIPMPEEPIKSEEMVPSPSTSDRSNGAGSPPPNCSICLGKLVNTSFTDSCLHKFCFTCLLQWSKIKTECPLCKQTFKSIIHNVRSEGDYDQYDVNLQAVAAATLDVAVGSFPTQQWEVIRTLNISPLGNPPRSFMYRTTMAPPHRRFHDPILNADAVARREQIPSYAPQVSRQEVRRRIGDPGEFRRRVYAEGIWAAELPDAFGRFRESSADYYRRHPGETHRLVPWLNRELQVLLNNNRSHIAYVINIMMDTITRYDINTPDFRQQFRPYLGYNTEHFAHEFYNFARSNFDLTGYDQSVVYQQRPNRGFSNEYVIRTISPSSTSFDSDSDSDVRLVEDDNVSNRRSGLNTLSVGPHMIDMPGPSTVGHALRLNLARVPAAPPVIYTISSSSSESENECEVVGYVKPRHERTPEIIDINSDEDLIVPGPSTLEVNDSIMVPVVVEDEVVVAGPSNQIDLSDIGISPQSGPDENSRCCVYSYRDDYFSSTSEEDADESDSDYNPSSKSRRRKKKSSKSSTRKVSSRKRKKSTGTPRKRQKSRKAVERCKKHSENESEPMDVPSTSRGTKRYLSDHSESEKVTKKSKKSKKTKSSRKSKKSKAKTPKYIESSSSSSSMSSDSELEIRTKKEENTCDFPKMEEEEEEEEPRYAESECSSRLRIDENSHSSDGDDDDEDEDYEKRKVKSIVAAPQARDSHSSDSEHSASTKTSRGRYRSHKKHKESKKHHRRSRS